MNELAIGVVAVVLVSTLLLLSVSRELAPAAGLRGRGRWWLAAALGAGVLAFVFKLVVIELLLLAPSASVRPRLQGLAPAGLAAAAPAPESSTAYPWRALPREAPSPSDNPLTPDRVELGRRLFFDKNLSLDRRVACASCHDPYRFAGADGLRVSRGIAGQHGERNAPTVWNAAFQERLFWDGRAASLEAQAKGPLVNPREMGMPSLDAVVRRVEEQPAYLAAFDRAFGERQVTIDHIVAAIAAFERTLITPDTPYDRFVRGDPAALNSQQLRGMALFETLGCVRCHSGPNFSSASVFDAAAPYRVFPVFDGADFQRQFGEDSGRAPPGSPAGVWRVPSLRNVALTAPYFHNGSVATLEEAVRIMARAQLDVTVRQVPLSTPAVLRSTPPQEAVLLMPKAGFAEKDVRDIVAFLEALSADELSAGQARARAEAAAR